MSAIFDVSSLCTILLLSICTSTYLRELRPTIFDAVSIDNSSTSSNGIGSSSTTTGTSTNNNSNNNNRTMQAPKSGDYINYMEGNDPNQLLHHPQQQYPVTTSRPKRHGVFGFLWKLSRIGERLSPYVGAGCALMAINILFFR